MRSVFLGDGCGNVLFGVVALVAGAGLLLLKFWARWLWLVACAFLLIIAVLATIETEVPWNEYIVELIFCRCVICGALEMAVSIAPCALAPSFINHVR